ncbi:hypothetical protein [Sphingobacterium sp. 18053]|uniref:hypothetical protein n=1 Tax=Sphingobacterium sp. 18053 TaxID=2681401 RepID=UPI00135CAE2B|nr:hypothetical protein [Sphingobacterium sp. 18053]
MVELFLVNEGEQPIQIDLDNGGLVTDMTYQLIDVEDITKGVDNATKTVKIVGNNHNNNALGYLFSIDRFTNSSNSHKLKSNFSFGRQVDCLVYENDELISKGLFRILKIETKNGVVNYEGVIVGYRGTFFSKLKESKIVDLDFSELTHTYNQTTFQNSLNNTSGYLYPLVDYGHGGVPEQVEDGATKTWDLRNYKPALFVNTLFKKIFEGKGYTYSIDGNFNNVFQKLLIPSNSGIVTNSVIYYSLCAVDGVQPYVDFNQDGGLVKFNLYTYDSDFSNNQSSTAIKSEKQKECDVKADIKVLDITNWVLGNQSPNNQSTAFVTYDLVCSIVKKESQDGEFEEVFNSSISRKQYYSQSSTDQRTTNVSVSTRLSVNEGDYVGVRMYIKNIDTSNVNYSSGGKIPTSNVAGRVNGGIIEFGNSSLNNTITELAEGNTFEFNSYVLPDLKQYDVIKEVMKIFNLVCYTKVENEKHIYFATYDEYFDKCLPKNLIANSLDWTSKLDIANYKITPISDVAKSYTWTYAEAEDWLNTTYSEKYKEVYGSKKLDGIVEYNEDEKTVESVFSAPIITKVNDLDMLCLFTYDENNYKEAYNTELRLCLYKGQKTVNINRGKWKKQNENAYNFKPDNINITKVGELTTIWDDGTLKFDMTFGTPFEVFYPTSQTYPTLFDTFFQKLILQQNNMDVHLLEAKVNLTSFDIGNLDLSRGIYLETDSGASYYKIVKINYMPDNQSLSSVVFQKIIV